MLHGVLAPGTKTRVGKMPRPVFNRGLHLEVISTLAKNCVSRASEAALRNFPFSVKVDSICWHTVVPYLLERDAREEQHRFLNRNTLALLKADER